MTPILRIERQQPLTNNNLKTLIDKLDLPAYIERFTSYLSRPDNLFLSGDQSTHLAYIEALRAYDFTPPPPIDSVDEEIKWLAKKGGITLDAIVHFLKVIRYLIYLKTPSI